jgi:hypothetical protein
MTLRDRPEAPKPGYLAGFLAGFAGVLGLETCGAGGVASIRRSTSSSDGGLTGRLVMVEFCRGG